MASNPRSFQYLDVYDKEIAELVMLRHIPTYRDEIVRRLSMVDALLRHCDKEGGECSVCSAIVCPFGNPLHFHHDGCPACHFADYAPSDPSRVSSDAVGVSSKESSSSASPGQEGSDALRANLEACEQTTVQGPMENLLCGLDEQSGALSHDELRAELAARGIDSDVCTAEIEAKILGWLRDNPLPCPFPSCDSRHGQQEEATVYVEERGGGYVAECRTCCSGTGSFHSREAALDEWNQLARAVLRGSSDPQRPMSSSAFGVSSPKPENPFPPGQEEGEWKVRETVNTTTETVALVNPAGRTLLVAPLHHKPAFYDILDNINASLREKEEQKAERPSGESKAVNGPRDVQGQMWPNDAFVAWKREHYSKSDTECPDDSAEHCAFMSGISYAEERLTASTPGVQAANTRGEKMAPEIRQLLRSAKAMLAVAEYGRSVIRDRNLAPTDQEIKLWTRDVDAAEKIILSENGPESSDAPRVSAEGETGFFEMEVPVPPIVGEEHSWKASSVEPKETKSANGSG